MRAQELVDEHRQLFSLPDLALRVSALTEDPHSSAEQIAAAVQLDAALAATVLKVANSAYYGLPCQVDSIAKAITLIGQLALRDLVVSVAVIRRFRGIPQDLVNMVDFWDNSVVCAIVARGLARRCGQIDPERMFLAGLMHKIGRLLFYASQAEAYRRVLLTGAQGDPDIAAAERSVFGFDYAELGAVLLQSWHLPDELSVAIASQLDDSPRPEFPLASAILRVAADMAEAMSPDIQTGTPTGFYWTEFSPEVLAILEMKGSDLTGIMETSFDQALELIAVVNPRR